MPPLRSRRRRRYWRRHGRSAKRTSPVWLRCSVCTSRSLSCRTKSYMRSRSTQNKMYGHSAGQLWLDQGGAARHAREDTLEAIGFLHLARLALCLALPCRTNTHAWSSQRRRRRTRWKSSVPHHTMAESTSSKGRSKRTSRPGGDNLRIVAHDVQSAQVNDISDAFFMPQPLPLRWLLRWRRLP